MRRIDDPFQALKPSIDKHGFDSVLCIIKVKEFITDCLKLKNYDIILIHGKGSGILRRSVHDYLKTDKRVLSYKLDNFNDGATIVRLKES